MCIYFLSQMFFHSISFWSAFLAPYFIYEY